MDLIQHCFGLRVENFGLVKRVGFCKVLDITRYCLCLWLCLVFEDVLVLVILVEREI